MCFKKSRPENGLPRLSASDRAVEQPKREN